VEFNSSGGTIFPESIIDLILFPFPYTILQTVADFGLIVESVIPDILNKIGDFRAPGFLHSSDLITKTGILY